MIKTYKYIALAALALGIAACTQEDGFTPQGNQKDAPLAISSAGVANLTTRATITTTDGTDYLASGSMGVFVTSDNTDTRYNGDNLKWDYAGGWKATEATVCYEADGESQKIGAYFPYMEPVDGKYKIELPETFGTDYEDYDYLYADYVAVSDNPMSIVMHHLLSKITVYIESSGTDVAGEVVEKIALLNVSRKAEWTVPTSTFSTVDSEQSITLYKNDADNDNVVYVGYTLPGDASSFNIRLTMQSGRIFNASASLSDGETLSGGVHYKIGLCVGKDKVTMSGISIAEWGSGETLADGTAGTHTSHNWENGVCTTCETVCQHGDGTTEGYCNVCNKFVGYDYNSDTNTWTVYNAEGIQYAFTKGGNITVAADEIAFSETGIKIGSGVTVNLDLNGKKLTGKAVTESGWDIYLNGGNLTITSTGGVGTFNAKIAQTGGTLVIENCDESHIRTDSGNGSVTLKSGTIKSLSCGNYYSGTTTIAGGTIKYLYVSSYFYGTIVITGGTHYSDPSKYVDTENYTVTTGTDDDGNTVYTVTAKTTEDAAE